MGGTLVQLSGYSEIMSEILGETGKDALYYTPTRMRMCIRTRVYTCEGSKSLTCVHTCVYTHTHACVY